MSTEERLPKNFRITGAFALFLGLSAALSGAANADTCEDSDVPCIQVTAKRIVVRDSQAVHDFLMAERERINQEALSAEYERKRQMQLDQEEDDRRRHEAAMCAAAGEAFQVTASALVGMGCAVAAPWVGGTLGGVPGAIGGILLRKQIAYVCAAGTMIGLEYATTWYCEGVG